MTASSLYSWIRRRTNGHLCELPTEISIHLYLIRFSLLSSCMTSTSFGVKVQLVAQTFVAFVKEADLLNFKVKEIALLCLIQHELHSALPHLIIVSSSEHAHSYSDHKKEKLENIGNVCWIWETTTQYQTLNEMTLCVSKNECSASEHHWMKHSVLIHKSSQKKKPKIAVNHCCRQWIVSSEVQYFSNGFKNVQLCGAMVNDEIGALSLDQQEFY